MCALYRAATRGHPTSINAIAPQQSDEMTALPLLLLPLLLLLATAAATMPPSARLTAAAVSRIAFVGQPLARSSTLRSVPIRPQSRWLQRHHMGMMTATGGAGGMMLPEGSGSVSECSSPPTVYPSDDFFRWVRRRLLYASVDSSRRPIHASITTYAPTKKQDGPPPDPLPQGALPFPFFRFLHQQRQQAWDRRDQKAIDEQ